MSSACRYGEWRAPRDRESLGNSIQTNETPSLCAWEAHGLYSPAPAMPCCAFMAPCYLIRADAAWQTGSRAGPGWLETVVPQPKRFFCSRFAHCG